MIFHLLCPGSGDRWRLGLRFWDVLTTGGVQDKRAVAVQDRGIVGSCSFLGFLGFRRLPFAYLTSGVVKCWIYEIYVDLLLVEE